MAMDCLLCNKSVEKKFTLPNVIDILRSLIAALEARSCQEGKEEKKFETIEKKLKVVSDENGSLKEEKSHAEKRAETYKQRFLKAQQTIQLLHKKNIQLYSQKLSSPNPPPSILFESRDDTDRKSAGVGDPQILAPDTCALEIRETEADVTYISSDEEDFRETSKKKTKIDKVSPRSKVKGTLDSYFVVPETPARKAKPGKGGFDFDETRLNFEDSVNVSTFLTDSELDKMDEEMDSIPPSPVLSGERRWFQKARTAGGLRNIPAAPGRTKAVDPDETVLDLESNLTTMETDEKQSERPSTSASQLIMPPPAAFTSLDAIFDKTSGDLETTSMLNDTNATQIEESDEDLDDVPESTRNVSGEKRTSLLDDSFDLLPKRATVFKPNEVVRKKAERDKLEGRSCPQCEAYYSSSRKVLKPDLPAHERKSAMKNVCRHKMVNPLPSTPEHFWELDIPSTAECRRRGYISDETRKISAQKTDLQGFRRKRRLQPFGGNKG